jgi:hypothetical protein
VKTGGCAYIKHSDRFIFYLVTKKFYNHKPYYNCVENSLKELLSRCRELKVTKLAMPLIATGLDMLDWDLVSRIIDEVFENSNINLFIYKFENPYHARSGTARSSNTTNHVEANDQ